MGSDLHGGDSSTVDLSSGVVNIYSSERAFAALKSDGSVVAWGTSYGGVYNDSVASSLSSGVIEIFPGARGFAAMKSDGSIVS